MKPMILKEPTRCCGSPTLLNVPGKERYRCPCGQLEVNRLGRKIAAQAYLDVTKRPRKRS